MLKALTNIYNMLLAQNANISIFASGQ